MSSMSEWNRAPSFLTLANVVHEIIRQTQEKYAQERETCYTSTLADALAARLLELGLVEPHK